MSSRLRYYGSSPVRPSATSHPDDNMLAANWTDLTPCTTFRHRKPFPSHTYYRRINLRWSSIHNGDQPRGHFFQPNIVAVLLGREKSRRREVESSLATHLTQAPLKKTLCFAGMV